MSSENPQSATGGLAAENLPLAHHIGARLHRRFYWVPVEDIYGYAYLGLALAEKHYDPSKGLPFARFASYEGMYLAIDEMRKAGVVTRRLRPGEKPRPATEVLPSDVIDVFPTLATPDAQATIDNRDLCSWVLGKIRPRDQQLLRMRYVDQLTFDEIAETFGITSSAVCSRHKTLIRRLQRLLRTQTE